MGGRGSSSATSVASRVNRYRITVGSKAVDNLRSRGASDSQIAKIASAYMDNRASGMSKTESRMAAERKHGFGSKAPSAGKATKSAKPKKASREVDDYVPAKVNGYGERTNRTITSGTYERAVKRQQKNLNSWFGRGM